MTEQELTDWKSRIEVVRRKQGRSLTTAIIHVSGPAAPPDVVLFLAAGHWQQITPGQLIRRPDEDGKQVYWVNILAGAAPMSS